MAARKGSPKKGPAKKAAKKSAARKAAAPRKAAKAPPRDRELDGLLAVAERAVEKALARGAEGAEAFVLSERAASLRIERGVLSNGTVARSFGVALRVLREGRLAFAYATDEDGVEAALAGALESARVLRPTPGFAFPEARRKPRVEGLHDPRVAGLAVDTGADACEAMMGAAKELAPRMTLAGGGLGWGEERVALANSSGARVAYAGTHVGAALHGVLRVGGATTTGFADASARSLKRLDFAALGAEAADLALRSRRPKAATSGETTVLMKPSALDTLLEVLFAGAVLGEATSAGRSVYGGRIGDEVMPPGFNVADDGTLRGGLLSAPVDDEGVPSRRTPIVEKGRLRGFLEDAAGAAERETRATASAVRADRLSSGRTFRAPPKATGRNVVFEGPKRSLDRLIEDVKDGVLVHDAMGAHTANAASGDFSVNASVAFRIRDGEIVGAAKPLLVSGNLPKALQRLGGLGKDVEDRGGGFSPVTFRVPTMRLEGLRVTSG